MTTISAVVFLYSPETKVASIAILNLDEAGETGAAAAMAVLIAAASTVATLLLHGAVVVGRPPHAGLANRAAEHRHPTRGDTDGPRPHPAHPRPADDHPAHQARDAARLGLVGRRLQRRDRRAAHAACSTSCTARTRTWSCRCRAAAPSASRPRWRRSCRRDGHVLVLDNGAYCKRAAQAHADDGPQGHRDRRSPRTRRCRPPALDARLTRRPSDHARGADPLRNRHRRAEPAGRRSPTVCARHGKGLIVDAMSSFGALPIDARDDPLRRAGRRQRQVPRRRARHGLRLPAQGGPRRLRRQQPDRWRWTCTTSTSTWRRPASGASRRRRTWWWRWPRR